MANASLNQPNLMGLATNLTNSNKWICYLPIENVLGREWNNLELHVTRFSLPQIEQGVMEAAYKGYTKAMPTKVINYGSKELTLEFLVDEQWYNYTALYAWLSNGEGVLNPVTDDKTQPITPSDYIPLRIYLLDNFKKKRVQFLFENCWIKAVNDIALEANNPNEVTASFVFCYDRFRIEHV